MVAFIQRWHNRYHASRNACSRRLRAAADEVARAYLFDAGFQVDPEFEQIISDDVIGRTLSRDEAADLRRRLRGDARYSRGR